MTRAATPSLPLPPAPVGHATAVPSPPLSRRSRAYLRKIIDPVERRSRAVGAMQHGNRRRRQLDVGIEFHDLRIVPPFHFAEKDVGAECAGEPDLAGLHAFDVHARHEATTNPR